jgi:3-oxoacyl-[acyl-carrier-protein] synthase-1
MPTPLAIRNVGLVSALGWSAAACCAALRAGISAAAPSRFIGQDGQPVSTHRVALARPWAGRTRLLKMLAPAVAECMQGVPAQCNVPLLLCVAEPERPGRLEGLDQHLLGELQAELKLAFDSRLSAVLPLGRLGALAALQHARRLIDEHGCEHVVVAAADSLLSGQTLSGLDVQDRLLLADNSNGFIPGEGAGAVLVSRAGRGPGELVCTGIGSGVEPAPLGSGRPLRAEGLSSAIRAALVEAGCAIHDIDFRISDISGEQYYFKEAALAIGRLLRQRKEEFDLWHPAEGFGEAGALAAVAMMCVAFAACRKGYERGRRILLHAGSDGAQRMAAVFEYTQAH